MSSGDERLINIVNGDDRTEWNGGVKHHWTGASCGGGGGGVGNTVQWWLLLLEWWWWPVYLYSQERGDEESLPYYVFDLLK